MCVCVESEHSSISEHFFQNSSVYGVCFETGGAARPTCGWVSLTAGSVCLQALLAVPLVGLYFGGATAVKILESQNAVRVRG